MGGPALIKRQCNGFFKNILSGYLPIIKFSLDDPLKQPEQLPFRHESINIRAVMNNIQKPQILLPILKAPNQQIPRLINTQLPLLHLIIRVLNRRITTTIDHVTPQRGVSHNGRMKLDCYCLDILGCQFVAFHPGVDDFSKNAELLVEVVFEAGLDAVG